VSVNGRAGHAADHVAKGDVVEYSMSPAQPMPAQAEQLDLVVIYQDDDLVVIDKPPGMVVHPAPAHHSGTLVNALLGLGGRWSAAGGEERPGIVHRLDKGTSGLIVAARNDVAHRALAAQLKDRSLSRTYLAVVRGAMKTHAGELEGPIGRHPKERKRMAVVKGGRYARTRYEVVERRRLYTLVRCDLDTGRTHQIRVHLASAGYPILGDEKYGDFDLNKALHKQGHKRMFLHAWRLQFDHPASGERIELVAPLPPELQKFADHAFVASPPV